MERRQQWLRGVLDLCVLGALTRGESYGYEIGQRLEAGGLGPIAGGTLYPALLRLERLGLVVADWRAGDGGPSRKYYRLSAEGKATLASAGADWAVFVGNVNAIMEVP
ncbi:transcriptional regulator [Actinoplanes sp. NBRC 14428]|uniref:PadR family transcriptional regulator PadR n=1 Tax=Pseudosporangium ferrugineum TaxID=439699 RepID=A0A2T0RU68_9ACTN|nr:PadR family transcriptional regulator [Pseudosporangium ferrugineum]PRY24697.1 PadR family transcriptional regulator PadR [Pseudosporangium ferrugineum]BCJ54947.1 transcriptional regulator [Actinoplanes sp. NBRC 14428]